MIRSAAKASISRTRSPSACCSTSSSSAILSSVIVISVFGFECCNPNLCRRSTVAATVTTGRALRYAGGSARGLLHQSLGHCRDEQVERSALAVADGMQLGVHAALRATDQASTPPLFHAHAG